MDPRLFSKSTPITDFSKSKPKYGENSPAQIIQKARSEIAGSNKILSHYISKPKPIKRENLTPVINTRIEKDDPNANRSQSANDSVTGGTAILAEFQALNAEARRRLPMNLAVDTRNAQQENKIDRNSIEPPISQSATIRSPKVFIIKQHKKTPSQEYSAGLKRTSIENESQSQRTSLTNTENKSRKTSNASNDSSNKHFTNGEHPKSQTALQNGEEGGLMQSGQQKFFDSIEENKSEKSNSGSPLSAKTKAMGGHRSPEIADERPANHINMNKRHEITRGQLVAEDSEQALKNFSSLDFGDTEIKIGDQIGEGAYGVVYKALNVETGKFIAVKHIKLAYMGVDSSVHLENLSREIEVYQKLEHENIVRYLGYKQFGENVFINMEYMPGGSVSAMLKQYGAFEEKVIKKFTRQVLQGLIYLHDQRVVHRDIKGGNILSDGAGNVKLADFGASKFIEAIPLANLASSEICNSIKGSLYWMAPELFQNEKHGRKIDIWSLGCTIIEMATAFHPWPTCKSYPELAIAIMTKKCPPIPEHLSDIAQDFIKSCCQFDKKLRPSAKDLWKHPFLSDAK